MGSILSGSFAIQSCLQVHCVFDSIDVHIYIYRKAETVFGLGWLRWLVGGRENTWNRLYDDEMEKKKKLFL